MPDLTVPYVLTTPGGTVTFNDTNAVDKYWISEIQGLVGTPVRSPTDDVPFGHGAIWYDWWESGRPIIFDGIFLIVSVRNCTAEIVIRNTMEENLRVALRSISALETDVGTLAWTPHGQSARQLAVRCNVPPETEDSSSNYQVRSFHFGLFAADPDWDGWSS